MVDINKVKNVADILYGRYYGLSDSLGNTSIVRNNDGNYIVTWTENGFEKVCYLTPEEYSAVISERDDRIQMSNDVANQILEDQDLNEKQEDENIEMGYTGLNQSTVDMHKVAELKSMVEQLNVDYERAMLTQTGHVNKVIRDFGVFLDVFNEIDNSAVKMQILSGLEIARNELSGSVSISYANKKIEELNEMVNENPHHFREMDLKRAKSEAKERYKKQSPLYKLTHLKERKILNGNNAGQIDQLYYGDTNGRSR